MRAVIPWMVLLALGCAEPTGEADVPDPLEETAPSAPQTPVERSVDELDPPERPVDPIGASTGFVAAQHAEALRSRASDPARAADLLGGACDRGFAPSCIALSEMLEAGEGVDADPARARGLLEQSCAAGASEACDRLGH